MSIGLGVALLVIGLILLFAVQADLPFVSDDTLGIILILGGLLVIVLGLILNAQRRRVVRRVEPTTTTYESDPPVV